MLRDLPANMRAAALHLEQTQASFQDVDEAQAHFSLMKQISGIERELLNWEQLKPRDITEAGRRKDEIKALKEQRDDLRVRVKAGSGNDRGRKSGIGFREEATAHRQQRRLAELRALGGDWVQRSGSWRAKDQQSGAFGRLVEQEKSNGSRNSSEKTVRRDLCAAAEAEANSKRSGTIFGGLGTP
jgi:hypothetical protein